MSHITHHSLAHIRTFYSNGNTSYESFLLDGKPYGTSKRYHHNGQIRSKTVYGKMCRGVECVKHIKYNANGSIASVEYRAV